MKINYQNLIKNMQIIRYKTVYKRKRTIYIKFYLIITKKIYTGN